jgi:hypothetical protein
MIYQSRLADAVLNDLDYEIQQILRTAVNNNRRDGLTGLLVCIQGQFIQTLEGPGEVIRTTYARIVRDVRHTDQRVLTAGPVSGRLFGDWDMCARGLSPHDQDIVETLEARGPAATQALNGATSLRLLVKVASAQRRMALAALTA